MVNWSCFFSRNNTLYFLALQLQMKLGSFSSPLLSNSSPQAENPCILRTYCHLSSCFFPNHCQIYHEEISAQDCDPARSPHHTDHYRQNSAAGLVYVDAFCKVRTITRKRINKKRGEKKGKSSVDLGILMNIQWKYWRLLLM